jgi:hypothetical protein
MLRSSLLVFIAGWIAWFWIDKPRVGPYRLPPSGDSLVENFQRAFDILKAGELELAFVYIWNAHYLILSLLGGAVVAMTYSSLSGHLSRRRMRNRLLPDKRVDSMPGRSESAEPATVHKAPPGDGQGE